MKSTYLWAMALMFLSTHSIGQVTNLKDGNGSHGGNLNALQVKTLEEYFTKNVKRELKEAIHFIQNNPTSESEDRKLQNLINDLVTKGLHEDIDESKYVFQKKCFDEKRKSKDASSGLNELKGEICWSFTTLEKMPGQSNALVALAFHEHIHHFGMADENHDFATLFLKNYRKSLKITDDEPLHHIEKWNVVITFQQNISIPPNTKQMDLGESLCDLEVPLSENKIQFFKAGEPLKFDLFEIKKLVVDRTHEINGERSFNLYKHLFYSSQKDHKIQLVCYSFYLPQLFGEFKQKTFKIFDFQLEEKN